MSNKFGVHYYKKKFSSNITNYLIKFKYSYTVRISEHTVVKINYQFCLTI